MKTSVIVVHVCMEAHASKSPIYLDTVADVRELDIMELDVKLVRRNTENV